MNYDELEKRLKEKHISRRKLSAMLGLSPNAITYAITANAQNGKVNTIAIMTKIAQILSCKITDLMTETELEDWMFKDIKLVALPPDAKLPEQTENDLYWERFMEDFEKVKYSLIYNEIGIDLKNKEIKEIIENISKLNENGIHELCKRVSEMASLKKYIDTEDE